MKNELLLTAQLALGGLALLTLDYLQRTRPQLMSDVGFWIRTVVWIPFGLVTLVVFISGGLFSD